MNSSSEEALFALVIEKPAGERSEFLRIMGGANVGLRRHLEALLAAPEQESGLSSGQRLDLIINAAMQMRRCTTNEFA